MGSSGVARWAGMQHASSATRPRNNATAPNVTESVALTPKSRLTESARERPGAEQAKHDADDDECHASAHEQPQHIDPSRAERHSDSNLTRRVASRHRQSRRTHPQRPTHCDQREGPSSFRFKRRGRIERASRCSSSGVHRPGGGNRPSGSRFAPLRQAAPDGSCNRLLPVSRRDTKPQAGSQSNRSASAGWTLSARRAGT